MTTTPLFLVSCVAEKAAEPCEARDLYRSDWFKKARAYVEALGGDWLILSAEHGILDPLEVVSPYDATLNTMHKPEREAWAAGVVRQLRQRGQVGRPFVVLAGERYREFLLPHLVQMASDPTAVYVPLRGLGIGDQKSRLMSWTAEAIQAAAEFAGDRQLARLERQRADLVAWFDHIGRAVLSRADCLRYLGIAAPLEHRADLRLTFELHRRVALLRLASERDALSAAILARREAILWDRAERQERIDRVKRLGRRVARRVLALLGLAALLASSLLAVALPPRLVNGPTSAV